jgi:hypothetical protein
LPSAPDEYEMTDLTSHHRLPEPLPDEVEMTGVTSQEPLPREPLPLEHLPRPDLDLPGSHAGSREGHVNVSSLGSPEQSLSSYPRPPISNSNVPHHVEGQEQNAGELTEAQRYRNEYRDGEAAAQTSSGADSIAARRAQVQAQQTEKRLVAEREQQRDDHEADQDRG